MRSAGLPIATMVTLMLSVFTVSIGFGIVLPLLPYLIERLLGAGGDAAQVSRHTGLLTAIYTLSLFLFAPLWGRLSDQRGPRGVLLIGLLGFGVTMLVFSFVESLVAVYAERFLSRRDVSYHRRNYRRHGGGEHAAQKTLGVYSDETLNKRYCLLDSSALA